MSKQKAKALRASVKRFIGKFGGRLGTIEGGDGAEVMPGGFTHSLACSREVLDEIGCPAGELAIIMNAVPTAKIADKRHLSGLKSGAVFPKTFDGYAVYYRPSGLAVAC